MFKLINKKCAECASPVEFDKELQDYVCLNSECQCWQDVGDDMAFDDCRKCGDQCNIVKEEDEACEGSDHTGEPIHTKFDSYRFVSACGNERYADDEEVEYLTS